MTCASRAIPSVPPFPPNRFNLAKSDWTSTSSSLAQCPLPSLEINKSRSTLVTGRNLPPVYRTIAQIKYFAFRPGQKDRR